VSGSPYKERTCFWLMPLTGFLKSSAREVTGMENATTRQVINSVKKLLILIIGTSS
jgi:hypothetical protein